MAYVYTCAIAPSCTNETQNKLWNCTLECIVYTDYKYTQYIYRLQITIQVGPTDFQEPHMNYWFACI